MTDLAGLQMFNKKDAIGRMMDDEEIYREVTEVYLTSAVTLLSNIKQGIERGNHELVLRSSHSLKSAAAIVGADIVSFWAMKLEKKGKEEDFHQYQGLFDELSSAVDDVTPLLIQEVRGK